MPRCIQAFVAEVREQILLPHHTEDVGQTDRRMDLSPVSIGQKDASVHNHVLDSLPHLARGSDHSTTAGRLF